jgi:hypothetical protein
MPIVSSLAPEGHFKGQSLLAASGTVEGFSFIFLLSNHLRNSVHITVLGAQSLLYFTSIRSEIV